MRSVKLKTTCYCNRVVTTLAHPLSDPGANKDCSIYIKEITNVPDTITNNELMRMFDASIIMEPFDDPFLTLDFSELGYGKKIIKKQKGIVA